MVDGRIQAFPWTSWKDEFLLAEQNGFQLMEWTLDQERLYENPLLTRSGQKEIQELCRRHGVGIPSLTGDCFMQRPFWKAELEQCPNLKMDFMKIAEACAVVGITMIVVPLVDSGRVESRNQEDALVTFLESQARIFSAKGIRVIFESDYPPKELARFIGRLEPAVFGINYDIGNSAALGFLPDDEFAAYGDRIMNVHVKDRVLGGTTVALGTGNADFQAVFSALSRIRYPGNCILQTARATDGHHAETLRTYRDMTLGWMQSYKLERLA